MDILRQSDIKKLRGCGLQFYLEKVRKGTPKKYIKMYLITGSAVHEVLQILHTDVSLMDDPGDVLPMLLSSAIDKKISVEKQDGNEIVWDKSEEVDRQSIIADFTDALVNYCRAPWNDPTTYDLLANEHSFYLELGSHKYTGTIDQVRRYKDSGKVVLMDFKTGAQAPSKAFLDRDIQHSLYSMACWKSQDMWLEDHYHNGEEWISKKEKKKPIETLPDESWWYQVRRHIPYKRAGNAAGRRYRKGDERGDPRIITKRPEKILKYWEEFFAQTSDFVLIAGEDAYQPNPDIMTCTSCRVQGLGTAYMLSKADGLNKAKVLRLYKEAGLSEKEYSEDMKNV